ncbi:MAG: transposase [Planctomycetota bacterium]|jgi:transposase-like protein
MSKLTVEEKMKAVILTFDANANLEGICQRYGVTMAELRNWKEIFLKGAKQALSSRSRDTQEIRQNLEQVRKDLTRFLKKGESAEEEA